MPAGDAVNQTCCKGNVTILSRWGKEEGNERRVRGMVKSHEKSGKWAIFQDFQRKSRRKGVRSRTRDKKKPEDKRGKLFSTVSGFLHEHLGRRGERELQESKKEERGGIAKSVDS